MVSEVTTGAAAVISTTSVLDATRSAKFCCTVRPTSSTILSAATLCIPDELTVTRKTPTGSDGTTYTPAESDSALRSSPVATLRTTILAPGTTAPLESVTVP